MNSICANQFISRKLMGFFAIRHSGSDKFDIDDALISLSKGANNLINLAPKYQSLVDQDLSLDHIINAQRADLIPSSKWGEAMNQIKENFSVSTKH